MNNTLKKLEHIAVSGLFMSALLMAPLTFQSAPALAHVIPTPCDFTTGGGFVLSDSGNHANFGLVGGCKNGGFYGHVNFVDHDTAGFFAGLHVDSVSIDGYFERFPGSGERDICGTARTNLPPPNNTGIKFRARTEDNGEPGAGVDRFGLKLTNPSTGESAVVVSTRFLAGGNIQLHKPNPSNIGPSVPPDEITACGSDDSGLGE
jgi:hypothetical protein